MKLASQGVEVVRGDANDPSSLPPVFQHAWATFLVTNFWDPVQKLNPETDWMQGKTLVDAALAAGSVKFIVWSSLHDVEKISQGTLTVAHYSNKNKVEQYIRGKPNIQSAFVYAGFYTNNWVNLPPFGVPRRLENGSVVLESAIRADVAIPLIDIELDFGQFVAPLFLNPSRYNGAKILASAEYLTVPQMAHTYERVSGEKVELRQIDVSTVPIAELQQTIKLFNRYGYYLGELIEPSHALYDNLKPHSFENWLRRSNFKPHA